MNKIEQKDKIWKARVVVNLTYAFLWLYDVWKLHFGKIDFFDVQVEEDHFNYGFDSLSCGYELKKKRNCAI